MNKKPHDYNCQCQRCYLYREARKELHDTAKALRNALIAIEAVAIQRLEKEGKEDV